MTRSLYENGDSVRNPESIREKSGELESSDSAFGSPELTVYPEGTGGGHGVTGPTVPWANIPIELRQRPQWCLAANDKRPLTLDGRNASVIDPNTWTDFDAARRCAELRGCGIGYVQTADDPFSCIDLDVKDGTGPEALQRYHSIIDTFDSYAEHSRSGLGFHVWVRGKIGEGRRRDGVEVYSQARFIICTGKVVRDRPIAERQDMLGNMVAQMASDAPAKLELWGDDHVDWSAATRSVEDTGELGRLFAGDWKGRYPSQSEADLALVKLLIPLTESPRECWLTFRQSKLGEREKAKRTDYAQATMAMAMQHLANDVVALQHGQAMADGLFWQGSPPHNSRHFRLMLDGDLERLPAPRWLAKGIIPDIGIGAIYGDSGTFKSFLALDLLAHVSNGHEWFGRRVKPAPAVYVPFEGQGGVPSRIKAWRLARAAQRNPDALFSVVPPDDIRSHIAIIMEPLNLREQADRETLVATLTEKGWAGGVLCIDTLAQASAGIDENSSAMGEMLSILRQLQLRLGGIVLVIHHSGKDASRGMRGWSGVHAAMDFVIECQRDKDSGSHEAEFVVTKAKDGETGIRTKFVMQVVQIGADEDGDYISSLVVAEPQGGDAGGDPDNPFKTKEDEVAIANADDDFVDAWLREVVSSGGRPTGRWLEANLAHIKGRRNLTQTRLRSAKERLLVSGRLQVQKIGGPGGAKWLCPVDLNGPTT